MMVMFPARAAERRTVRPVSSEYFSKIWSTGALKNLRKFSARSACAAAPGSSPVPAAGTVGGATWPAMLGVPVGAAFVVEGGAGNAGNATTFVFDRGGRIETFGASRRLVSGVLVVAAGKLLGAVASTAPTGALVAAGAG